ncbi:hypothetical protein D9M69_345730 [compost metagenome]
MAPAVYWPRTVLRRTSSGDIGRNERNTLSFSSRTASELSDAGGSMARMLTSCSRWFWIMSRMAPASS